LDTKDAEGAGGYAKAQSDEFYRQQREQLGKRVAASDVVITTALVPGQRAPLLIEESAVRAMRPGSAIVDLAAEKGGNCACTQPDREVVVDGVRILGPTNLPGDLALNASQMYAKNLVTLLLHLVRDGAVHLDLADEITKGALLTHEAAIATEAVRPRARRARSGPSLRAEQLLAPRLVLRLRRAHRVARALAQAAHVAARGGGARDRGEGPAEGAGRAVQVDLGHRPDPEHGEEES